MYLLRQGATRATAVGRASDAIPTRDGRGLWLWRWRDERPCTLAEVGLDGRPRRQALRLPCAARPVADTDRGLLAQVEGPDPDAPTVALLDRRDGHRLAGYADVIAVSGDLVLTGGGDPDQGPFTLTDRRTGVRRRVPRPPGVGRPGGGLPSPDRRLLAVEFGDPAWYGGPGQVMDVWLLDLGSRRWRRLPGMPVLAWLKLTGMVWTADGRLPLLGGFDRRDAVAVWWPGQDRLALRRLRLPADRAGSDSFVPR